MPERISFPGFTAVVRRRWMLFVGVAVIAAALGALFSGPTFMKPRFRSTAVVYPVNLNSYSIETRADQLLQLLESNSIRDSLVRKFGLVEHYGIDTAAKAGRAALFGLYKERVEIGKTRYESVEIDVTDEDPVLARDMVNEILRQVDLLNRRLMHGNAREVLTIIEQGLAVTRERSDSVNARLDALRSGDGLLDYKTQTEELTKAYMRLVTRGGTQAQKDQVLAMLKDLERKGGEFHSLSELNDLLIKNYSKQLADHQRVLVDVDKELSVTNVVVYPEVSDKKVYPVRWLVVVLSVVSALLLAYVLVFLRDQRS